jgi:hypothetical protein
MLIEKGGVRLDKKEYLELFTSDFLVVTRNRKVVRVMCNNPGAVAVFMELGGKGKRNKPHITYYDGTQMVFDPFEVDAYVAEYIQNKGGNPKWKRSMEATLRKVERILDRNEKVEEVEVDEEENITIIEKEVKGDEEGV